MKKSCYKLLAVILMFLLTSAGFCGCENQNSPKKEKLLKYADMTAEEITASLTLEQKANQMVMAACMTALLQEILVKGQINDIRCKTW